MSQTLSMRVDELIERINFLAHLDPEDDHYQKDNAAAHAAMMLAGNVLGKECPDLRPAIKRAVNTTMSEIDQLEEGDQTPRITVNNIRKACAILREEANRIIKVELESIDQGLTGEDRWDAEADQILKKNQVWENKLRAGILNKNTTMGIAPIIPMTNFNRDKLNRMGIPNDNLRGYTVLNQQRVLGITYDYVINAIEKSKETDPLLVKKLKRVRTYESFDDVMKSAVDSMFDLALETYKARFPGTEQVGLHTSWNGARWYWIMKKRELAFLRSAALNEKNFQLKHWNFAFPSRMKTMRPNPHPSV